MSPAAPGAVSARLRTWWRGISWYVRGVLGENAYQQYLDHHRRTACDSTPLTERDYWRRRTDWQERNPQGRCC